jgi:hypothetical protein
LPLAQPTILVRMAKLERPRRRAGSNAGYGVVSPLGPAGVFGVSGGTTPQPCPFSQLHPDAHKGSGALALLQDPTLWYTRFFHPRHDVSRDSALHHNRFSYSEIPSRFCRPDRGTTVTFAKGPPFPVSLYIYIFLLKKREREMGTIHRVATDRHLFLLRDVFTVLCFHRFYLVRKKLHQPIHIKIPFRGFRGSSPRRPPLTSIRLG